MKSVNNDARAFTGHKNDTSAIGQFVCEKVPLVTEKIDQRVDIRGGCSALGQGTVRRVTGNGRVLSRFAKMYPLQAITR